MDQQYNYSPRDFVTVSARADTIESLAGQESEIRNVGPEPERATVTLSSSVVTHAGDSARRRTARRAASTAQWQWNTRLILSIDDFESPLSVLGFIPFPLTTNFMQMSLFHQVNFDSSIPHLQDALQHISSWMTANLLSLYSKLLQTILAHRTQKPTCQNTQLFTWHLPLCSKSWLHLWRTCYLSSMPVSITFVNFAVSGLTSIHQLPVGLPLLPL